MTCMNRYPNIELNNKWILSKRGIKNKVDPNRPYGFIIEKEYTHRGIVEEVGTIFLTNRECPFHCLMCDLWKNTTDTTVPPGSITRQLSSRLKDLIGIKHLKLYNSGNFFDPKAIRHDEYGDIATNIEQFESVLVESHPKLVSNQCLEFQQMIKPGLQVAMGLETVHPQILKKLNKQMTLADFEKSVTFLTKNGISVRAFILLRPPFMTEEEGVLWAKKSLEFAFNFGVECCVVIPTRPGNGALDWLEARDFFHQPSIRSLEEVMSFGLSLNAGRVFADLWDLRQFSSCDLCFEDRMQRFNSLNLSQKIVPSIQCECDSY